MFPHLFEYLMYRTVLRPLLWIMAVVAVVGVFLAVVAFIVEAAGYLLLFTVMIAGCVLAFRYAR
jgi:hypothetical protein